MKLKGAYDSSTTYNVGDVVMFTDGFAYHLQNPAPAGAAPVDTRYWGKVNSILCDAIKMAMDAVEMAVSQIPDNINDEAILLKGSGENEYAITVDDSGDTPELDVTLVEEGD